MLRQLLYNYVLQRRKKKLQSYGTEVYISRNCNFQGKIILGNDVSVGPGAYFVSTGATLRICDHVVFGPNVTIYTGDHPIDVIGYHICEITDNYKKDSPQKYDADVIIEEGCWIGTHAIILKGVTIGKGSVIGAGAIVTKDVPPYSIYTGVPNVNLKPRFTAQEIEEHERLLQERHRNS